LSRHRQASRRASCAATVSIWAGVLGRDGEETGEGWYQPTADAVGWHGPGDVSCTWYEGRAKKATGA